MKTTIRIILICIAIFSQNLCYGWSFEITAPTGGSCAPSNYYYNSGYNFVDINFTISGSGNTYYWYVRITQGGSSHNTTTQNGSSGNKTVQLSYSNICFNNDAQIEVFVNENGGAWESQAKYFRLYSEIGSLGCITGLGKYVAVDGETSTCLNPNNCSGNLWFQFYNGPGCALSAGAYSGKRYKVEWTKSGNFTNSSIIINDNLCNGYSPQINNNYQWRKGYVDNITSTSAHFYTYVYYLYNGSAWQWYPCAPQDAAVVYSVVNNPSPVFSHFTQSPTMLYQGQQATVTLHLSQGDCCGIGYSWSHSYKPSFMSVTFSNNTATITYNSSLDGTKNSMDDPDYGAFRLNCTVTNDYGSTGEKQWQIIYSTNGGGGCPWIIVQTDTAEYTEENNILHRSEFPENIGEDITDIYKLNSNPYIDGNNEITIKVIETAGDYSYFDQLRLFAVDHLEGTSLGVTEDNQLVLYTISNVISTDSARFNDTLDITENIQFDGNGLLPPLAGDTLDHAYAHYPSNSFSNLGIITKMQRIWHTPVHKRKAGNIICNTSADYMSSSFAIRELSQEIIIPFSTDAGFFEIYDAEISFLRDFETRYIALAEISPVTSFTELPLNSAHLSNEGDLQQFLRYADEEYLEMDSNSTITLKFNHKALSPVAQGYVREYVFMSLGRYSTTYPSYNNAFLSQTVTPEILDNSNSNVPNEYKLYVNYPNPFNPVTELKYDLKKDGLVKLQVFNILGQLVIELVNEYKNAGSYKVQFDASNLASGLYIYHLESGDFKDSKKMIFIK